VPSGRPQPQKASVVPAPPRELNCAKLSKGSRVLANGATAYTVKRVATVAQMNQSPARDTTYGFRFITPRCWRACITAIIRRS
jgi:hypothetical protein